MKKSLVVASVAATLVMAVASAGAATVTVFPGTTWFDQNTSAPLNTSQITADVARSGNGSLRVEGPRSRFATGTIFPTNATVSMGLLSALSAFSVDVRTDVVGSAPAASLPTIRLHLFDPTNNYRSELIWENAEVNTIAGPALGSWYSVDIFNDAMLWRFVNTGAPENGRTAPVGLANGTLSQSITDWINDTGPMAGQSGTAGTQSPFSAQTFIGGISIGIGGGATGYVGYADNLRVAFTGGSDTTYNFEVRQSAAVPEPASLALAAIALLAMGAAGRRQSRG
jgi:hypothetical protein